LAEKDLKTQNALNGLETRSSYVFIFARWLAAESGIGYFFVATPRTFSMLSSVLYYTGWGRKWEQEIQKLCLLILEVWKGEL
jgi:hypothetical protein